MQGMHYRAIDQSGQVHTGFSSGANEYEVEQWVLQRGWQPLPVSNLQRVLNVFRLTPKAPAWSKVSAGLFTLNFAQLLDAGVPLLEALEEIAKLENSSLVNQALLDVCARVDRGESLSDSLARCPSLFSAEYVASVRAGERSGKLVHCLELQAANLHWQSDLINRLKTVLAYPIFALCSLVVVLLFVLLYLVPAMQPLLSMHTGELPLHTQWLLNLSALIRESGSGSVLGFVSIVVVIGIVCFTDTKLKRSVQSILLSSRYGQIISCLSLARYARTTSLLYEAGIEITDAMQISQSMVANQLLQGQLKKAAQLVLAGQSLGAAMQSQPLLPVLFVRMVIAGERAGVLSVALKQSADQLQSNAQYALDRLERLIGPGLLCIMGALLLWVATAVLGPIYSTITQTGGF